MSIQTNFPAIKPSLLLDFANTKQLDPRITFTRASTATYYNGVTTAKAEQNLLTYSQEFDNAVWDKNFLTVTANSTTAPDGTTTAETLTEDSTTAVHLISRSLSNSASTYTVSFFAKPNGRNFIYFAFYAAAAGNYVTVVFDVSTGAVTQSSASGSGFSVTSSSITASTNGFYRCVATFATGTTAFGFGIGISNAGTFTPDNYGRNSYAGNGTSGVYLWGAQLEQRSAVTAYTATTTQAITNYIPQLMTAAAGVPRFDCNPTTDESLGLLIEEQRTNLLTYSEQFDNAAWTKTTISATANNVVSPDGTVDGDTLTADGTTNSHDVLQSATVTGAMTCSVYVKKATARYVYLVLNSTATGTDYSSVSFDLDSAMAGTVVNSGNFTGGAATITSVGNSWYRLTLSASTSATTNYIFVGVSSGLSPSLVPRGRVSFATSDSFRIWGAQLEAGAFATSYIPTVASQVTRSADSASMTGTNFSSWFAAGPASIYSDFVSNGYTANQMVYSFTLNSSSSTNPIQVYFNAANSLECDAWGNGTVLKTVAQNTAYKYAIGIDVNNMSASLNADAVASDTSVGPAQPYTQFNIGNRNGSLIFNGTIKKLAYYPLRVTNANLQALTS